MIDQLKKEVKKEIEREIEHLKIHLSPVFEALRSGDVQDSETAGDFITRLLGLNDWIDREFCQAVCDRVLSGRGIPMSVQLWFAIVLSARATGKSWNKSIQAGAETIYRGRKTGELIYSVERARAKGLKTSRNGEPGEAFEEAAKVLGIKPSTVRDLYYKLKRKGEVDVYRLGCKLAHEILDLPQEET